MSTSYLHTTTFSSYKIKRKIDLLNSNFLLYNETCLDTSQWSHLSDTQ